MLREMSNVFQGGVGRFCATGASAYGVKILSFRQTKATSGFSGVALFFRGIQK